MRAVNDALPQFRLHPDPVQSGVVEASSDTCGACEQARGFVYTGPCYVEDDFDAALCPWCIADGGAFRRFGVTFHEVGPKPGIDLPIAEELEERTPGILSFQPIDWPVCCGTAMAYLEPSGHAEIVARYAALLTTLPAQLAAELELPPKAAQELFLSLQRDQSPCAHVFRCLLCRALRGAIDGE